MRKVIDTLIALMLITLVGGLVWHYQQNQKSLDQCQEVQEALTRMYEQAVAHATVDHSTTHAGFPTVISAEWFRGEPPLNVMAPGRPWVDVAPRGDMADHPPDPILEQPGQAGFWYNPNRGLIRARIPRQMTDLETADLYNRINQTALKTLRGDPNPERTPIRTEANPAADATKTDKTPRGLGKTGDGKQTSADQPATVASPALKRRTLSDVSPKQP